jgi:TPR repeat protein
LGVPADAKAAEQYYRQAAQGNNVSAQLALGDLIAERATTKAAWGEAARWFRMAAKSGNKPAKARLVKAHENWRRLNAKQSDQRHTKQSAEVSG